jgi:hypothetical protein
LIGRSIAYEWTCAKSQFLLEYPYHLEGTAIVDGG